MKECDLKYFEIAAQLNSTHHDALFQKQCHFRAGCKGISLISLRSTTPELGIPRIRPENALKEIAKMDKLEKPKRATPEKMLQAWLIRQIIYGNPPDFWNKYNLSFLTSELALEPGRRKIVNDILAIDNEGAIWVIELKSDRQLTELIRQCNDFEKVIVKRKELFIKIVAILGNGTHWDGRSVRKMIVWPASEGDPREKTRDLIKSNNIEAITYRPLYDFKIEC
ncbi:MAG: hypothetical protein M0042_08860 [Nitrospiraceae bacterium]|nr:hypothetical protein [Nitrospiraceae bacterium]